ncbi:MAG: hypothetical protein LCH46_02170 [Proteobacteria bacterium]|nr:hypothetical protein [Pseudomonadota bacterium]
MDWLTFIANVVAALAWPVGACMIALIFRSEIRSLFSNLSRLKWGEMEANFGESVEKIREEVKTVEEDPDYEDKPVAPELVELASTHPHLAVLEGWKLLERAITEVTSKRLGIERTRPIQVHLQALSTSDILPRAMVNAISDIRGARNRAAHEIDAGVSTGSAYLLLDMIADITAYLEKAAGKN